MEKNKTNIEQLIPYTDLVNDIFETYNEVVFPLSVHYQVIKGEYPVFITHRSNNAFRFLGVAMVSDSDDKRVKLIEKASYEMDLAAIEALKADTVSVLERYDSFMEKYKNVDLTLIQKGTFLSQVTNHYAVAKERLKEAREMEMRDPLSFHEIFQKYEDAFCAAGDFKSHLDGAIEDGEYLRHKAEKKDRITVLSLIVGVIGVIVGVIGFLI